MKILAKLAVAAIRALYFFFKLFLRPSRKIAFLSRQSDAVPVDFEYLNNAVNEKYPTIKTVVLTKRIPPSLIGKIGYAFHILVQMYHIATSKVVVVDGYSIAVCVLNHKKEQKFVQLWHALNIVKKFGFQALDKPWGHTKALAESMCMHRNYTHVVACSEASGKVLLECFNASREKLVLLPLPRIDYILHSPDKRQKIEEKYPDIFKKPILIYAPTFRAHQKVDLSWIGKTIDFEKYNVVVKLHPADKQGIDFAVDSRVVTDSEFSSFDWMKVCDKIITDYSGVGFEAMLLGKQVYYYLYDYQEYKQKNGLNLDLFSEEISLVVTESAQELKHILEKDYDFSKTDAYIKKYLSVGSENCSSRLAEFIFGLL